MLRGRSRVVVETKSGKDVTDQSIGYTGCGGSRLAGSIRPHAEKRLVAEIFTIEIKVLIPRSYNYPLR